MSERVPSVLGSIEVRLYVRGIRKFGGTRHAKVEIDWFLDKLRARIQQIVSDDQDPGSYDCNYEPAGPPGSGCKQMVCRDEYGNVVLPKGPVECPPQ